MDLWLLNHGMPNHLTNPSFVSTCSDTEGHMSLRDALTFVSDRLPWAPRLPTSTSRHLNGYPRVTLSYESPNNITPVPDFNVGGNFFGSFKDKTEFVKSTFCCRFRGVEPFTFCLWEGSDEPLIIDQDMKSLTKTYIIYFLQYKAEQKCVFYKLLNSLLMQIVV